MNEQEHHKKAFEFYYGLGEGRSYKLVAEEFGVALGTVKMWGRVFGWRQRCRERDAEVTRAMVVYAKPPFGGPEQVLKYLARYTHRVAISNRRLLALRDGRVSFQWTDYASGNRKGVMSLEAVEFIRRFLLHVLPTGFMHIRYYGFLANRMKETKLALARTLIPLIPDSHTPTFKDSSPTSGDQGEEDLPGLCPACKKGRLILVGTFHTETPTPFPPTGFDTS